MSSNKISLEKYDIKHVINIGFEVSDEEKIDYVSYENMSLDDNVESTDILLKMKDDIIQKIKGFIDKKENTLVCCVMGKSRSPSIILLYLKTKYPDISYNDAVKMINDKRKININYGFSLAIKNIFGL
jgi:protein-tyrosine phosphatase